MSTVVDAVLMSRGNFEEDLGEVIQRTKSNIVWYCFAQIIGLLNRSLKTVFSFANNA